jgi:hypothetical protein
MGKKKKQLTPYWRYPAVRDYMTDYNRSYYQANREKIISEATKRNKLNEAELKVYMKKYYSQNRDRLLKYAKKRKN